VHHHTRRCPCSRCRRYVPAEEGVAAANAEAGRGGPTNSRFEVRDAAEMKACRAFDLITAFDSIHDQARPDRVLGNIAAALKTGGTFLMQDIAGSSHLHEDIS